MNIVETFLIEDENLNQTIGIINQLQNQCNPIRELIISLSLTYLKTPKGIKEYISRSLIKSLRKSIKNPFNSINHLLYLFEKSLKNPSDELINFFNSLINDISNYIKTLVQYSMLIRTSVERKDKNMLNQYINSLQNLFFNNIINWYNTNLNTVLSLSNQESLNQLTDIDFNLVKDEVKQQIFLHQDHINKELAKLTIQDHSLKPYYSKMVELCNSTNLIDNLDIIKQNSKTVIFESNRYLGQYKINDKMSFTISHFPQFQVKITQSYLPIYISSLSYINVENFKETPGNNFTIKCRTEEDLNILNNLSFGQPMQIS